VAAVVLLFVGQPTLLQLQGWQVAHQQHQQDQQAYLVVAVQH
jgi:hypothetical protein